MSTKNNTTKNNTKQEDYVDITEELKLEEHLLQDDPLAAAMLALTPHAKSLLDEAVDNVSTAKGHPSLGSDANQKIRFQAQLLQSSGSLEGALSLIHDFEEDDPGARGVALSLINAVMKAAMFRASVYRRQASRGDAYRGWTVEANPDGDEEQPAYDVDDVPAHDAGRTNTDPEFRAPNPAYAQRAGAWGVATMEDVEEAIEIVNVYLDTLGLLMGRPEDAPPLPYMTVNEALANEEPSFRPITDKHEAFEIMDERWETKKAGRNRMRQNLLAMAAKRLSEARVNKANRAA